jgi:N-acetylated-alpha-linked acidic dipeptidase
MQQADWEAMLLTLPTATGPLDSAMYLNREAHYAGSNGDWEVSKWMNAKLNADGFQSHNEAFKRYVDLPVKLSLSLLAKPRVDFDLHEGRLAVDPDGTRPDAGLPFNAGSGSGDVTAPVVYVGRGTDTDYAALTSAGVSVAHRIVLVRYGGEFRGAKANRAQAQGAAGIIFYSDPLDNPSGPPGSVQHGSLGDPALRIPSLPVTSITARTLLQDMRGVMAPAAMHGAMDAPYLLGTTRDNVHLDVKMKRSLTTLWNTVAVLPGTDPSHFVVLGAHRDAWVYGVTDDGSGIEILLESAHALGYLARSGWKPRYSIYIVGFDGEEIGEVGSNAYVLMHQFELRDGAIAYINSDEVTTGEHFDADAAAGLTGVIENATSSLADPRVERRSLAARWREQRGGIQLRKPAGGSDFEPFLYELGIPTMEAGFGGGPFGVYHSGFDDLHFAQLLDPNFANHRTLAQLNALLAFRLTLGPLPYRFDTYVPQMRATLASYTTPRNGDALKPLAAAIDRYERQAAYVERHGYNGGTGFVAIRRLDKLYYGRSGYGADDFPTIAAAGNDPTALASAANAAAAELDGITALLAVPPATPEPVR